MPKTAVPLRVAKRGGGIESPSGDDGKPRKTRRLESSVRLDVSTTHEDGGDGSGGRAAEDEEGEGAEDRCDASNGAEYNDEDPDKVRGPKLVVFC